MALNWACSTSSTDAIGLDGGPLTPEQVERIARGDARVEIDAEVLVRLGESRAALEALIAGGEARYGINTGFGSLSRSRIDDEDLGALQLNLIRSHSAGVGEDLPRETVRAMMALLAASLCRDRSGVRPMLVEGIVAALNAGFTPRVPSIGSVGASGDLAPLAHAALALLGEGDAITDAGVRGASETLAELGLEPITLEAKEGLALINGTHLMAGEAALLVRDAERLVRGALVAMALSMDACLATDAFLDARVFDARARRGPAAIAATLSRLLDDSEILRSHPSPSDPRVQDPYSFRCAPAVLGASVELLDFVAESANAELAAVTDNPLVFRDGGRLDTISAGNFHGMPIAIPLDSLTIALAHVAGVAERRTYHMLSCFDPQTSLPAYLSPQPGLHSGLMILQYTQAACCNELVGLSAPASVANLSTSAGVEDYNSFGPRSAAKARRATELCEYVVAGELLAAAQAVDMQSQRLGKRTSRALCTALQSIRRVVPTLGADRPLTGDVEALRALIRDDAFGALFSVTR